MGMRHGSSGAEPSMTTLYSASRVSRDLPRLSAAVIECVPLTMLLMAVVLLGACNEGSTIVAPTIPSITTTSLPNGTAGTAYSHTLAATGGDGSYTWSMFNATSLAAGLMLHAATGVISGTPTEAGTTNFEVEVTSAGQTATQALSITIAGSGSNPDTFLNRIAK